eukprot:14913466-Ditylum_brightwellii.AAC.1
MNQGINCRNTYFKISDSTKIHGDPTAGLLLTLKNKVKANAVLSKPYPEEEHVDISAWFWGLCNMQIFLAQPLT